MAASVTAAQSSETAAASSATAAATSATSAAASATAAATSATNPLYTMTCLVNNTTDINGSVADLSTQSVTWNVNGTITIATS